MYFDAEEYQEKKANITLPLSEDMEKALLGQHSPPHVGRSL